MFICPNCQARLVRTKADASAFWACNRCGGRAVALSLLRKTAARDLATHLWLSAREGKGERKRPCPVCSKLMVTVPTPLAGKTLSLDVCTPCQFVWFDPKEYEDLPAGPPRDTERELPPEARVLLAKAEAQLVADRTRRELGEEAPPVLPEEKWKLLPLLLGMPAEEESPALQQFPLVTWTLAAVISLVSLFAFQDLGPAVYRFGLVAAQAGRYGGLTFLTSFFLHAGLLHLIGNMYFLMVFGDNVEDYLGRWRYLLLLLLATIVGDLLYILFEPGSTVPSIGASRGISGVIAFYALQFPDARISLFVFYRVRHIRARTALFLWFLLQLVGAAEQLAGLSQVSSLAHLGGAGIGLLFWLRGRKG